ncbi:hypothetical protein F5887DRAFT_558925 [Amanita rubescens]|nr:hypothetical protein F5887DRAFT_558925 [Amanita rubescens]
MKRDDHEKVPLDAKNDSDEWTATDVPDGSSIKSTKKMAILWAAKPIAALVVQLIFLTSMLSFVIWTSITPRQVPRLVANLSQSIITVHTLIGSTLSLINTM